jgi:hypothetical protein
VNVNGNPSIQQTGIAGYAFPIGTQKQSYQVFDAAVGKAEPFAYSGTATVRGIETYMFDETVGPTPAIDQPVPASYQNHVVYYVDPVTGIPLDITEHEVLTAQSRGITLFDANLAMTPSTVNSLVNTDNRDRNNISLLETILPLVAGILGALLLLVGVLLARRRSHDEGQTGPATAATDPAAATQEGGRSAASGESVNGTSPDVPAQLPAVDREPRPETSE